MDHAHVATGALCHATVQSHAICQSPFASGGQRSASAPATRQQHFVGCHACSRCGTKDRLFLFQFARAAFHMKTIFRRSAHVLIPATAPAHCPEPLQQPQERIANLDSGTHGAASSTLLSHRRAVIRRVGFAPRKGIGLRCGCHRKDLIALHQAERTRPQIGLAARRKLLRCPR